MKTLNKAFFITSLCLVISVPAYAGHGHQREHLADRMERQQQRIEHGIESHRLTRKESKILRKQQRRIRHLAREFREDGHLTKKERRILKRKLDNASEQIWLFKHNNKNRHVKQARYNSKQPYYTHACGNRMFY